MSELTRLRLLLGELGIRPGGVLMVHTSLSGTGLPPTLVRDALLAALGPDGTLVVPAFTPENSDTSRAHRARVAHLSAEEAGCVPGAEDAPLRPGHHALSVDGRARRVRAHHEGAVRSAHPQTSLAGIGARAAELLSDTTRTATSVSVHRSPGCTRRTPKCCCCVWGSRCAAPSISPSTA